jgi:steroid 5-alpha reductase family enzyme
MTQYLAIHIMFAVLSLTLSLTSYAVAIDNRGILRLIQIILINSLLGPIGTILWMIKIMRMIADDSRELFKWL